MAGVDRAKALPVLGECPNRGKSIRKEVLEGEFDALLANATPTRSLVTLARAMFRDIWDQRQQRTTERRKHLQRQLREVQTQIENTVDRIVNTDKAALIDTYENRLNKLACDKALIAEKLAAKPQKASAFEETFRTAMAFLSNPQKLWRSERLEDKRAALKLTFADKLRYARNEGFRTIPKASIYGLLGSENTQFLEMARPRKVKLVSDIVLECL